MDPARFQRLQSLFAAAREASDGERESVLQAQAGDDAGLIADVRALLRADAASGPMEALGAHFQPVAQVLEPARPARIGAYQIVRELGRGGMGVVYLADRADGEFRQRVAIKLIPSADATDPLHQRFLAERQILAALTHPNIARLLDGGVTDEGRPYLVMEYIDGVPITTYCETHRLDIPARLRLFMEVCAAVHHAHQNLIVHRDLKPTNILVTADGHAHLLDFGIAKLINPAFGAPAPVTRADARLMTPEYASPEQVRAESLTTASDIYSLGVLLYELLCGRGPYRLTSGSPVELATAICEQDPDPPSVRQANLRDADLDSIVLMAMRKEPARRYRAADMLREDLERYLNGQPVLAHRDSRRYRFQKFLRRHRVEAAAVAMVAISLVAGLSVSLWQGRRAAVERDRAAQALAEATGITNFLMDMFQTGTPGEATPAQLSALDLLRRGAARADELSGQPVVQARLLDVVGQLWFNLGQYEEAQRRLEQAVAIRRSAPGNSSLDLASSLIHLARVYRDRDRLPAAIPLVDEALGIRREALPADHPDIADALFERGRLVFGREQEGYFRQALGILSDRPETAEARVNGLHMLATNLRRQGRLEEAVTTNREALAAAERSIGPEHASTGLAMVHQADNVDDDERDAATAERLYRRGLELIERRFGANSLRLVHGLNSLGSLLGGKGDPEAEVLLRRSLAISRSASGPDHPRVADQMGRLAGEIARQGRLTEAETLAREALDLSVRLQGPRSQSVTSSRLPMLAGILNQQQRYREADEVFRVAFEQAQRPSNVIVGQMHRQYGLMLLGRKDYAGAERQLHQSLDLLVEIYSGQSHPNVQETKRALMSLYQQMGRPDEVERYRVPPGRFIPR
jgi:serine/threonine-protein kinase